jgi:1-acyl-sn-glycerol-3-phosphate acyltransferase
MNPNHKLSFAQRLARAVLHALGWRVDEHLPDAKKYVMIGAPHTSNWDFIYMLLFRAALGLNPKWAGKDTMFHWSIGWLWKGIGGIPVNRRLRNNFVDQMAQAFRQHDEMILVIAPEGTRNKVGYWKSGFYHIAHCAGVPIALGYLDFGHKIGGIGPLIMPTGDIRTDFVAIQQFYAGKVGKFPHEQSEVKLQDPASDPLARRLT